jgi:arylsulfatase A-like enzyme
MKISRVAKILFAALIFAMGMMGLQLLTQKFVKMLGQDMSGLGQGVLHYYPSIAATEGLKLLTAMTIVSLPFVTLIYNAWYEGDKRRRFARICTLIVCTGLGSLLIFTGSYLKFPALYEMFFPDFVNRLVFRSARFLVPRWLETAGWILLVVPGVVAARSTAGKITLGAVALAIGGLIFNVSDFSYWGSPNLAQHPGRPNIFIFAVDSLRYDRLRNRQILPEISALLEDSQTVVYEDHQVGIPRTFPSWVEILQGRYAAETGIRHMFPGLINLRQRMKTLPHALTDLGYETSVVSDFAGDIFPRFDSGFKRVKAPAMNLETMIQVSTDLMFPAFFPVLLTHYGRSLFSSLDESPSFADPAWLAERAKAEVYQADGRPIFLTVFFSTAHFPYAAPWPFYWAKSDSNYGGPFRFQKNPDISGKGGEPRPDDVAQVRALYDGALMAIDSSIGSLIATLKGAGVYDDSMIIITADHGEDLFDSGPIHGHGEHLVGDKVVHVPLVIKFPREAHVLRNSVAATSRSIDIAPTILKYLAQNASYMTGISLLDGVLNDNNTRAERESLSETGIWFSNRGSSHFQKARIDYPSISQLLSFDPGGTKEIVLNEKFENVIVTAKHRALTYGDYKIIYMPTSNGVSFQLFNRRVDPGNLHDLAGEQPEVFSSMKDRLLKTLEGLEAKDQIVQGYTVPR